MRNVLEERRDHPRTADIPCRFVTAVPDMVGGVMDCFSPACRLNEELSPDEPLFGVNKCDTSCAGYQADDIAECPQHGQYIASHGCLICDAEGAKS